MIGKRKHKSVEHSEKNQLDEIGSDRSQGHCSVICEMVNQKLFEKHTLERIKYRIAYAWI